MTRWSLAGLLAAGCVWMASSALHAQKITDNEPIPAQFKGIDGDSHEYTVEVKKGAKGMRIRLDAADNHLVVQVFAEGSDKPLPLFKDNGQSWGGAFDGLRLGGQGFLNGAKGTGIIVARLPRASAGKYTIKVSTEGKVTGTYKIAVTEPTFPAVSSKSGTRGVESDEVKKLREEVQELRKRLERLEKQLDKK